MMLFISYSRRDRIKVKALVSALDDVGIEYWLDESNIPVGEAFVRQIGNAIRRSTDFLLVDTESSSSSYWVSRELYTAARRKRGGALRALIRISDSSALSRTDFSFDHSFVGADASQRIAEYLRTLPPIDTGRDDIASQIAPITAGDSGQPSNWFGRQEELERLDQWWSGDKPICWIRGVGGMGKTGLLKTWATALIELGYEEAADVSVGYVSVRDLHSSVSALWEWVSRTESQHRLVLFDGFDETSYPDDALKNLIEATRRARVRALVSARVSYPAALSRETYEISLDALSSQEAADLLTSLGASTEGATALANEVGAHPLALLLIGRQISHYDMSSEDVLRRLRETSGGTEPESAALVSKKHLSEAIAHSFASVSVQAQQLMLKLASIPEDSISLNTVRGAIARGMIHSPLSELVKAGLVNVDRLDAPSKASIHEHIRSWLAANATNATPNTSGNA